MLAALAAMVLGERENTLTMLVASWTRSVLAATYANRVKASKPHASPLPTTSRPTFSISTIWSTASRKSRLPPIPIPAPIFIC